jgi:Flp pilus assembly protein TadB
MSIENVESPNGGRQKGIDHLRNIIHEHFRGVARVFIVFVLVFIVFVLAFIVFVLVLVFIVFVLVFIVFVLVLVVLGQRLEHKKKQYDKDLTFPSGVDEASVGCEGEGSFAESEPGNDGRGD